MTTGLVLPVGMPDGLQPLDVGRHLGGLADLIELCFARELDEAGRSFILQLRGLSQFGPVLRLAAPFGLQREIWTQGMVWVEGGRVIGAANTQPAGPGSTTWLVANVAVHPEHRRRGLGLQLMRATLEHIRRRGGREVALQVDVDNSAAIELYRRLGFTATATHVTWTRPARAATPADRPGPYPIRLRTGAEWLAELSLAELVRPEGLTWNRPLTAKDFRPSLRRQAARWLIGQVDEHWVAPASAGRLAGALIVQADGPDGDRLTLLAHPADHGRVEAPLLAAGLRRLGPRPGTLRLEHPAGDPAAEAALRELGFTVARALRWLKSSLR